MKISPTLKVFQILQIFPPEKNDYVYSKIKVKTSYNIYTKIETEQDKYPESLYRM